MFKFRPENELERELVRATVNPAFRPRFYRAFVRATVYVIPQGPPPTAEGRGTLRKGTVLALAPVRVDGASYLPFYSSARRMAGAVPGGSGCLGINAFELLKLTRGAELLLNPGSGFGKVFTRQEIDAILDGTATRGE